MNAPAPAKENLLSLQRGYIEHLKLLQADIVRVKLSLSTTPPNQETLVLLHRQIHNLSGSGTTFGFPQISTSGLALEAILNPCLDVSPAEAQRLMMLPEMFHRLEEFEKICQQVIISGSQEVAAWKSVAVANSFIMESKVVLILGKLDESMHDIERQLRHFGYQVTITNDILSFNSKMEEVKPHVLIVYSELTSNDLLMLPNVSQRGPKQDAMPQLIVVSPRDDFEARLSAIRLGAQGYFTAPADVLEIIDKIEQLFDKYTVTKKYHALIVDDDEMLIKFYTHALRSAGITVTSVSNPKDALKIIAEQSIDLVLIDFLMPYCNGQELASIIRQHAKYVSLPIIFMSARDDVESLLINTGLGIDDFLVKPVTGDQLVSVVRSRASRSAELQGLMARDSFTGLLNHGHFMDMLGMELVQAKRYKTSAAYVIIDIDHFKQINDTYGHAAGDHVIKSLARMLQQRLRRSDIVGRCGGEEFGIIMPDCDKDNAVQIVESLRAQFAELLFKIDHNEIRATFSAGLTLIDHYEDADEIIKIADKALYSAKNQGRNSLVIV